jgi:hypothetical protein
MGKVFAAEALERFLEQKCAGADARPGKRRSAKPAGLTRN